MADIYVDHNHHGNRIVEADLREIGPQWLHPAVLTAGGVVAGPGIVVEPGEGGTVVVGRRASSYRERFTVLDPKAQEPLVVKHGLGSAVVSVTVAEVGEHTVPVAGQVVFVDKDTVEVLLTGEAAGVYEVLVLADGGPAGAVPPSALVARIEVLEAQVEALQSQMKNLLGRRR